MKKQIQNIIPGTGIGELRFGMSKEEVEALVGPPDDVDFVPDFDGDVNESLESWHYDTHEFSVVFDADFDWKVVSIAVSDPYFTLNGQSVIGMKKDKVKQLLKDANIEISNEEDISDEDNPDMQLIESEDAGLIVWFDEGEAERLVKEQGLSEEVAKVYATYNNIQITTEGYLRTYKVAASILKQSGINRVRLMTNNPQKQSELSSFGIEVVDRVDIIIPKNQFNIRYLDTKREKMGHLL